MKLETTRKIVMNESPTGTIARGLQIFTLANIFRQCVLSQKGMSFFNAIVNHTVSYFSGEPVEETFEQFYETDQITEYLDSEFLETDVHYIKDEEEKTRFLDLKTQYYNALQGIQFQNQCIYNLVSDLLELKMNAFFEDKDPNELKKQMTLLKMDISDRKTKRYFYRKKRQELTPDLSKLIGVIKLEKFRRRNKEKNGDDASGLASVDRLSQPRPPRPTMRRRKGFKLYSDAELKEILR